MDYYDKEIREIKKKLAATKESVEKLLNLALEGTIPKGSIYKEKMDALETEIAMLGDKLDKAETRRKTAELSVHSGEYLHANLRFAMENPARYFLAGFA